jgi:hypothetical protein
MTPKHPGTITYVDGDTGETLSVENVIGLSEEECFAETAAGLVPIVKVVATMMDESTREIVEYGPGDERLRSTIQFAD